MNRLFPGQDIQDEADEEQQQQQEQEQEQEGIDRSKPRKQHHKREFDLLDICFLYKFFL